MAKFQRDYPALFQPVVIRNKMIKNRLVSSPHGDPRMLRADRAGFSVFSEDAAVYYGNIARGGAAIVNTGHLGVDPRFYLGAHREYFDFNQEHFVNARILPPMHRIVERVHAYGALASIELNHGGQWCTPLSGNRLIGPSDLKKEDGLVVEAMDEAEMEYVADCFAKAAFIGKRAGFDMVNIHAGHNWLLGEFLSPIENQRTDRYGGSVENRARFPKLVADRVRERIGEDMLIEMRISATEIAPDGITLEEVSEVIDIMAGTVDIVQCSAGRIHDSFTESFTFPSQFMQQGCNSYLAREIKKKDRKCLIETVGGIDDPEFANGVIQSGGADLVGMARAFIADPDWGEKAKRDSGADIRPCIRCLHCMDFCEPLDQAGSMSYCSVNPRRAFLGDMPTVMDDGIKKKVAVIGAGPAGMLSAIEIADRGHDVVLFERCEKLGGRLEFADFLTFKRGVKKYRDYLIRQVKKRQDRIDVRYGIAADESVIEALAPDAIVVATGAQKFVPAIKGVDLPSVIHAADLFRRTDDIGERVVVIGGGDVGCEITIQLQTMGKTVDVIEMEDALMKHSADFWENKIFTEYFMTHEYKPDLRNFDGLQEVKNVSVHLNAHCTEITERGVAYTDGEGTKQFIEADTVILSTGLRANHAETFDHLAQTVVYAGDRKEVSNIENATRTAYAAALQI